VEGVSAVVLHGRGAAEPGTWEEQWLEWTEAASDPTSARGYTVGVISS